MKFDKNLLDKPWFAMSVAACSGVLLYMLLSHFSVFIGALRTAMSFLSPVFLGMVIAYIIDPLAVFFEKNLPDKLGSDNLRRSLSITLSLIVVALFLIVLMVALIPQVIDSVVALFNNADTYSRTAQRLLRELGAWAQSMNIDISSFVRSGNELLSSFTASIPKNINNILHTSVNFGRSVANTVIGCIMALYFLSGKSHIRAGFKRLLQALLPERIYDGFISFAKRCNNILIRYIAYDLLDGIIVGVANWLFMLAVNMPYAVLISVVVGVTNLAPTFGPIVGGALGAFILVLVKPLDALIFLAFTLVLQTLDGYVIKPKLFGDQLGVSPIWILVSLVFFGRLFGVTGILLAIPIAAILDYVYEASLRRLELKKSAAQEDAPPHESVEAAEALCADEGEEADIRVRITPASDAGKDLS